MERLNLTPEQQTEIDAWVAAKAADTLNPMTPNVPGLNLVPGDHVEIDNNWKCVVLGGGNGGVYSCVPDWGMYFDCIVLQEYITDRAGPNGETMPVEDEVQIEARVAAAAKAGSPANPKQAARAARKEDRDHRRDLRELIKAQPDHHVAKRLREAAKKYGALGKDD